MDIVNNFDVFDIVGPIMVGPSSSHTAGAVRIGLVAGQLCDYNPKEITVLFHGSLKSTYSFHKTDVAVVAGILGMKVDDEQLKDAIQLAEKKGVKVTIDTVEIEEAHPSTILIYMIDHNDKKQYVRAATIGGGNIYVEEINEYKVNLDGKQDYLLGRTTIKDASTFKEMVKKIAGENVKLLFKNTGEYAIFSITCKKTIDQDVIKKLRKIPSTLDIHLIKAIMPVNIANKQFFKSCSEWVEESKKRKASMHDLVIDFECKNSGRERIQVIEQMKQNYMVMKKSIEDGLQKENILLGNIFSGNAKKMEEYIKNGKSICGINISKVVRNALAIMEVNGSMGKIVACPTAGSAGTVPAALITVAECNKIPEEKVVEGLFVGAGLGMIITQKTSISGSVCGCQGECGCASAMAAAMITQILDGNDTQILSAFSLALGNILGLVCDPVAGMVEIPCIQRNTMGAVNAIICAEMALAGIDSVIPADEMIGALDEVGKLMDISLKDTLGAGISNTPTARAIEKKIFHSKSI
ncbi:L-serine ammonia-lyase, iron-sulfur-dependent, subunit alpha [Clostridiaceae bacterium 35-E11]